jgi:hypothetical protein
MQTDPPKADSPKRKRRWFQFSLRALLILTLICVVGSAWVARRIERKRNERRAVEAFRDLGGVVAYGVGPLDSPSNQYCQLADE